ncbi:MAG: protoheme IX farnesyltransferase [Proteobacteria bacterium]|nr:protoheme IX farnesyltransferase [Pseudomonadota bacterium]
MTDHAVHDMPASVAPARWQDYVQLLKPRVMSLVIFTALTGLLCARTAMNPVLAGVAILCIAVGAGGSAALNMWYDSDIDARMRRTRGRPVPAGRVQGADALALGITLSLFSVGLMGLAVNWLSAGLLAFTILFYAVVYTMWLKRSTAQNIVIGGLAGALPPAVGWAAAAGAAPLNAWLLVAIIFMWTPPHFWALSLYTQSDYAKAGVPMMPVVRGAASTRRQILGYSLALIPLCLAPAFTGLGGAIYLSVAAGGGAIFLALAARLAASRAGDAVDERLSDQALYDVRAGGKAARNLFAFSILYLFVMFAALLVERMLGLEPLHLAAALKGLAA